MKKILGYLMSATPFVILFVCSLYEIGLLKTLLVYGILVFLMGWVWLGVKLSSGDY